MVKKGIDKFYLVCKLGGKEVKKMKGNKSSIEFEVQIFIEPDEPGFHAYCPALKGLHTCGDTQEEALSNAKDAAIAYLHSLIKHGDPIPVGIKQHKTIKERLPLLKNHSKRHAKDLVLTLS